MPRYKIQNKVTGEVVEVEAPFAQIACERIEWLIRDCYVQILREGPFTNITEKPKSQTKAERI